VLEASVTDCEFPSGTADCVAVWNTFDQLPDPEPALRAMHRCLKPDGIAVIRVPNGRCFEECVRRLPKFPQPLRSVLLAAMAWNNLLSFPYLHGFSTRPLDLLLDRHGFVRRHASGDVLTRLSDEQTRTWARWEETLVKKAWVASARVLAPGTPDAFPWIDVYYRKAGPSSSLA
jgi:SAM-dependent methyltransferase